MSGRLDICKQAKSVSFLEIFLLETQLYFDAALCQVANNCRRPEGA
jgi:hypothetical protein